MRQLLAAGFGVILAISAAAETFPNAAEIAAAISRDGAAATVRRLEALGQWDGVLDQIGAGRDAWIQLAPLLASGTDAASSEGLGIALAQALPANPGTVLRVLAPDTGPISVARVCSTPFIERPPAEDRAYDEAARQSLRHISAADLIPMRDRCIAGLQSARGPGRKPPDP